MIPKLRLSISHRHFPLICQLYKQTVHFWIIPLVTSNLSENNHLLGLGYKTMSSSRLLLLLSMYYFLVFLLFKIFQKMTWCLSALNFRVCTHLLFTRVTFHELFISTVLCIMCIYSIQYRYRPNYLNCTTSDWHLKQIKQCIHSSAMCHLCFILLT